MGGCSLILLLILAIPLLIIWYVFLTIFGITLSFMTISGVAIIILAITLKIIFRIKKKSGEEIKPYARIISTIILIIGILLITPTICIRVLEYKHSLKVKKEKLEIENLYNKVVVKNHREWHDEYFILNNKKVIYSRNLYLPENYFFIKKEVVGHLVYEDTKKLKDALVILQVENNTNYPMFLIESIEYKNDFFDRLSSRQIHIYEEDEDKIRNYYANSKNQIATIHYVNDKSEYKVINSDFQLSDLINLERHYDDQSYLSLSSDNIVQSYFFVIQSEDEYYTDYIAIVQTKDDYYLIDNKDHIAISSMRSSDNTIYLDLFNRKRGNVVRNLTLEEKEYIKELINKAVEE